MLLTAARYDVQHSLLAMTYSTHHTLAVDAVSTDAFEDIIEGSVRSNAADAIRNNVGSFA